MERIQITKHTSGKESDIKCAKDTYCFPLSSRKRNSIDTWIEKHDLFVDSSGRAYCLVDTKTEVFFMDAITGSLYQFGNCLTSERLKTNGMRRNKKDAIKFLMDVYGIANKSRSVVDVDE